MLVMFHALFSLLSKPQQLWNFKNPFIFKIVYKKFCLFEVSLTFNLLSPDLIIHILATYQTLIHMMYIMYTTHILAHLIWIRCLLFTKATTNFSVFHLNICSLAKNFYKLQDFVSMLNKAPSCIAIIVDLPFRITTCRFLLAIVFRTWGLVCINLSFASREFVCARSTAFAHDLDSHCIRFCPSTWTPRFERIELCIARHRKAFLLLLIRSLL